jgi:hypothetical protein
MTHRTDMTSEIDGALAGRNLGSRHFSDAARSGNGNMLSDLSEDQLADYDELDGMGEITEALTPAESLKIDRLSGPYSAAQGFQHFRAPGAGEVAPFAPKQGMAWMRKRSLTGTRQPGGTRVVRTKWVQMSPQKLQQLAIRGDVAGMGAMSLGLGVGASAAIGIGLGIGAWLLLRKKKG